MRSAENKMKNMASLCSANGWWLIVGLYSIAMLPAFLPLLLQVMEPKWDAMDWSIPAFTYIADAVREGRFPLWDPYTNCGYPFHADPGNSTLNPVAILFGMLFDKPSLGFNWFWVTHWWWGGVGMIFLAWHFGACRTGAFVAAISYALSGFFVGHAQHTSFIMTAAWLPWIFALADRSLLRSNYAYALLSAVAIGYCTYGGYPGLIQFACLALGVWLALRFLPSNGSRESEIGSFPERVTRIVIVLAIVAVVLVLIWSPVLHAFYVEGNGYTDRVGALSPQAANDGDPFSILALFSLFFPYVTFAWNSWMGADISMTNGYMGLFTLPLAAFWLSREDNRQRKWWLVVFVLLMFWVSLGGKFGLRTLLYYVYPPMRFMRFSAPFRIFWIMPVCLAAGLGLSHLVRHQEDWRSYLRIMYIWTTVILCAAGLFGVVSVWRDMPVAIYSIRLFMPALIISMLTGGQLWYLVVKKSSNAAKYAAIILAVTILADMTVNLFINADTVWVRKYNSTIMDSNHKQSTFVNGPPVAREPGMPYGDTNAQQVFKKPLVQGYMTMKSGEFDTVLCQSRFVEVLSGKERFWLSPGGEEVRSRSAVLEVLAGVGGGTPVPAFVEKEQPGLKSARVAPATFGSVEVKKYSPEKIEMAVVVPGATKAILMSTERYSPGWKVFIDGATAEVLKVNLFFRGVYIQPGEHSVTWLYQPNLWILLVVVSYLTVFAGTVIAVIMLLYAKRNA